jgi:hypothetical protein
LAHGDTLVAVDDVVVDAVCDFSLQQAPSQHSLQGTAGGAAGGPAGGPAGGAAVMRSNPSSPVATAAIIAKANVDFMFNLLHETRKGENSAANPDGSTDFWQCHLLGRISR